MLVKKLFSFIVLLLTTISSCNYNRVDSSKKYKNQQWWITDHSQLILKVNSTKKKSKIIDRLPYLNYDFLNTGYSCLNPYLRVSNKTTTIYSKFYFKNGSSNESHSLTLDLYNKSEKDSNYIDIKQVSFYTYKSTTEKGEEEVKKSEELKSLFTLDTKLIPYETPPLYLINTNGIKLFNDDISLYSGDNQFSFLTGQMKDSNGSYKEVVFKSTSNTTFKIYELIDGKEIGFLLLEGEMSEIKDEDQLCSIDFNVTKDRFFQNKYSSFSLNIKLYPSDDYFEMIHDDEDNYKNLDFFFPENLD